MWGKGIYPPFDVIMSLSRLAKDAIGEGKTREDHKDVANTLISAYSKALELRSLATLVGERNLGWRERRYLRFADAFEQRFIKQGYYERRSFEETLDIGWDVLSILPEDELTNARPQITQKFYRRHIFESVKL
jgi:V/A-type H+-transporting ATPase subunit B